MSDQVMCCCRPKTTCEQCCSSALAEQMWKQMWEQVGEQVREQVGEQVRELSASEGKQLRWGNRCWDSHFFHFTLLPPSGPFRTVRNTGHTHLK